MGTKEKGTKEKDANEKSAGAAFSAEERAAMKARAAEVKAQRGRGADDAEAAVLAAIADLPEPDRAIAERVHAIVREAAPGLVPRTWYGMPAYARPGTKSKPGPIICFVQPGAKFGTRYATLGFNDGAQLDDGPLWPTAFALTEMTDDVVAQVRALVERAVGPAES